MDYYEICVSGTYDSDILLAKLSEWPFESFMEKKEAYCAYIQSPQFHKINMDELIEDLNAMDLQVVINFINDQNWNVKWESNFQPVIIQDFCALTADFHSLEPNTKFHIKINPRMAFGTGHHETTWMMIDQMSHLEFKNKSVFDYGTGTGVLAILAKQMGAGIVHAIDYDINSIENSVENAATNNIDDILFDQKELEDFNPGIKYDIILANINLPVLLDNGPLLHSLLKSGGLIMISGIMTKFEENFISEFSEYGFKLKENHCRGEWSCIVMNGLHS